MHTEKEFEKVLQRIKGEFFMECSLGCMSIYHLQSDILNISEEAFTIEVKMLEKCNLDLEKAARIMAYTWKGHFTELDLHSKAIVKIKDYRDCSYKTKLKLKELGIKTSYDSIKEIQF